MKKRENSKTVAQDVENDILLGVFRPKERLVESDLMARYNAKRNAVRMALHDLEHKGLVRRVPNKGATVADLSVEDISKIYFLRHLLELTAVELAGELITEEEISELERIQCEYKRHVESRDLPLIIQANNRFHDALFRASRNEYLVKIIHDLQAMVYSIRYYGWPMPGIMIQTVQEHDEVLAALNKKDMVRLKELWQQHLAIGKNAYLVLHKNPNIFDTYSGTSR
mgnify:CR=1 FL=1